MIKVINFLKCLAIPLLVGGISGFFTSSSIKTWYVFLKKPSFNPPNYLFGPVWTILYLLMGISLYIIVSKPVIKKSSILVFALQLILNFLWSFIFFKYQQIGLALIEILLLWAAIFMMIINFYKVDKIAAYLNIPYLLWVSFATILNYSIYSLN